MGIDFNNLLNQLGKVAASMQNQRDKIDTDSELNTYVSGWDAIKAKANEQNSDNDVNNDVDMATLETQMKSELAGLMGADFGKSKGIETKTEVKDGKEVAVFTDEEALEGLMSALSETMDAEMTAKVAEYNAKHPELAADTDEAIASLKGIITENHAEIDNKDKTAFTGFDSKDVDDLMEVLGDSAPKVFRYMSHAIENGRADAISASINEAGEGSEVIYGFIQGNKDEIFA